MTQEFVDPNQVPVAALFELTSANFEPDSFKLMCEPIGRFDEKNSDDDLWSFDFQSDFPLKVSLFCQQTKGKGISGELNSEILGVSFALLCVCWWDSWDRMAHRSPEAFERERAEFDKLFEAFHKITVDVLGEPLLKGRDTEGDASQYSIWRGKYALLVLQQSKLDLQFGYDINYWIQPWIGRDPSPPKRSFIEWLQAQTSVPPLFELPKDWIACGPGLEDELKNELRLNLLHPLRGVKAHSCARHEGTDDVLFQLSDFKSPLAEVHLTWSMEHHPHWPSHRLHNSWQEWREHVIKEQELCSEEFDEGDDPVGA